MEISNKASKAITITVLALTGTICLGFLGVGLYFSGALFAIGALFSKRTYLSEISFPKNGLYIYNNETENELSFDKLNIEIQKYDESNEHQTYFIDSNKVKYGLNVDAFRNEIEVNDCCANYLKKAKVERDPYHETYKYYFSLSCSNNDYVFSVWYPGFDFILFSIDEPITISGICLDNHITE